MDAMMGKMSYATVMVDTDDSEFAQGQASATVAVPTLKYGTVGDACPYNPEDHLRHP